MVEAGRIELPSEAASIQLLRACSVYKSRQRECRQTGSPGDQRPRFVKHGRPATRPPAGSASRRFPAQQTSAVPRRA